MEKVINLLNDIEEKATSIVDHTSVEKKALYKQLTKDMEKLDNQISGETQKKLDVIRTKMNQEIEDAKKDLVRTFEEHMNQMEDDYQKNHETYVDSVFQKIISE